MQRRSKPSLKSLGINRAIGLEAEGADALVVRVPGIEILMRARCYFGIPAILEFQGELLGQMLRKEPVRAPRRDAHQEPGFGSIPRQVEEP